MNGVRTKKEQEQYDNKLKGREPFLIDDEFMKIAEKVKEALEDEDVEEDQE
ncbi:hypothetical protein KKG63_03495 [Patescibacteria group bacterium]|nr:hypothetical protein [Patescibacteria group bacterium]MBU2025843.1 hypothetical protein [Patescibacteria group bacterium]